MTPEETQIRNTYATPLRRWSVLCLVSFTMLTGYVMIDAMAPLKTLFEQRMGWNSTDYGIFTSGYGWFNIFLLMLIFGGIIGAVFLFFVLMDISAILAVGVCWIPLVFAVWFYFRFVREKPKYYFDYWLNSLFGTALRFESRSKARKK